MSSQRRIDASRANGARSRGPVTPEGKARSSRNSLRHGLLASHLVLEGEDGEAFQQMLGGFCLRLQPDGDLEAALVEEMTTSIWRQRRCLAIERSMVDDAAARSLAADPVARMAAAYAELASGPGLPLIHRYETRLSRAFQRALNNLLLLRKNENLPNEPNPISEHGQDVVQPVEEPPDPLLVSLPGAPLPEPAPDAGPGLAPLPEPAPEPASEPAPSGDPTLPPLTRFLLAAYPREAAILARRTSQPPSQPDPQPATPQGQPGAPVRPGTMEG